MRTTDRGEMTSKSREGSAGGGEVTGGQGRLLGGGVPAKTG